MSQSAQSSADKDCYVYVIAMDDMEIVKVGISDNPERRLTQLRTSSPFPMRLAHKFCISSTEGARQLEKTFHAAQEDRRKSGEWFDMDADHAIMLMSLTIMMVLSDSGVPPEFMRAALESMEVPGKWLAVSYLAYPGALEEVQSRFRAPRSLQ